MASLALHKVCCPLPTPDCLVGCHLTHIQRSAYQCCMISVFDGCLYIAHCPFSHCCLPHYQIDLLDDADDEEVRVRGVERMEWMEEVYCGGGGKAE